LYHDLQQSYERLKRTQDYLMQSEKLRALGEMASGMAHDFNNMLTVIVTRAERALLHTNTEKARTDLEIIEQAALDAAQSVRRLQGFCRPAKDLGLVQLDQLVDSTLQMIEPRRLECRELLGIDIDVEARLNRVEPVEGSPSELRQALTNIILNAIDAMPNGGTLTVETHQEDGWVIASIGDTGVGIPDDARDKVFQPFFSTKGAMGFGLGLSVAHSTVAQYGGRIEVESAIGKGSTFRVRLPALSRPIQDAPSVPIPTVIQEANILLVDDDDEVREALELLLSQLGYRIAVANRGQEGLTAFSQGNYDMVITDLGMPDLSGREVAKAVKKMRPGTPVLLITGWGIELEPSELLREGVDAIIAKPFRKEELLAGVARVLRANP
jgi:CheY-like chemotaxis protein